jgi:hypothetical protein
MTILLYYSFRWYKIVRVHVEDEHHSLLCDKALACLCSPLVESLTETPHMRSRKMALTCSLVILPHRPLIFGNKNLHLTNIALMNVHEVLMSGLFTGACGLLRAGLRIQNQLLTCGSDLGVWLRLLLKISKVYLWLLQAS